MEKPMTPPPPSAPRAVLADDEPLLRAELCEMLARVWPALQVVAQVGDGRAAVAAALEHKPDVVFLDVSMPRLDGMAAAQQLRQQGFAGDIVFVTAYDQYAVPAFAQRAIDYLVKPLEEDRLRDTVTRLQQRLAAPRGGGAGEASAAMLKELQQTVAASVAQALSQARPAPPEPMPWVRVVSGNQIQLIATDDIACFRAVPGYTQVTTCQGEHLISEPLAKLLERLNPQTFVQVHRASIVNLRFVAKIHRERPGRFMVELKHGLGKVEASRARADFFRDL
jgi:DNA-binding LytR/AlgR family response regulator